MVGELSPYIKGIRRSMAREADRRRGRLRQAREEIDALAEAFKKIDPDIQRIVLFGSLVPGKTPSADFDIDLAVECTRDRYLSLVSRGLDSLFRVDVVDLTKAPGFIQDEVRRFGVVLHER